MTKRIGRSYPRLCRGGDCPVCGAVGRGGAYPSVANSKYADVGWFGMTLPAEYGGGGYAALDAIKVTLPPCYFATLSLSQSSHFLTIVSTDVKLV
ncbi:MAG TPA: hypothetical protein EYP90_05445 [Chromatiaceae bacterium]|nr:hypothetical protein [Chromatiaceae bacterium]